MNSTLAYVISQQVNRLLLGPGYLRWLLMLSLIIVLGLILINRYVVSVWDAHEQLDRQYSEINAQLGRYQLEREQINQDYNNLTDSLAKQARLEQLFSNANSDALETILVQHAINNDLVPSQVQVNTQLLDDQGKYFRIIVKLSGAHRGLENFLEKIMLPDYFLIWEKLRFDVIAVDQLSLTISLKQYIDLNDK